MSNKSNDVWGDVLQRSFDSEVMIYQYLYQELTAKEIKKYPKQLERYSSRKAWERHVISLLKNSKKNDLEEMVEYLKLKERKKESEYTYYRLFSLPFLAASTTYLISMILNVALNLPTINNNKSILLSALTIITVITLTFMLYKKIDMMEKNRFVDENFYSDYRKVIEKYLDDTYEQEKL